jgi:AcrR family transcriptional regulator
MAINTVADLLSATQELLLERGESKTTLRAITELANANVAAVNYHFGSRDALIQQAYKSALEEVTLSQGSRLRALEDKAGLEEFVQVWLGPLLDPKSVSKREKDLWALLQRGSMEHSPQLESLMPTPEAMEKSPLIALLKKRLPNLEISEIVFRHNAILSGLGGFIRTASSSPANKAGATQLKLLITRWVLASLRG